MQSLGSGSAIGILLLVVSIGCKGSPTSPPTALTGMWGGNHVSLAVTETGSHLEFDCAHGDMPGALPVDATGTFSAAGTYVREHGGPIRDDETPDAHPATYGGTVAGVTMQLIIRLTDTHEVIGAFTLDRDTPGRVVKCL